MQTTCTSWLVRRDMLNPLCLTLRNHCHRRTPSVLSGAAIMTAEFATLLWPWQAGS